MKRGEYERQQKLDMIRVALKAFPIPGIDPDMLTLQTQPGNLYRIYQQITVSSVTQEQMNYVSDHRNLSGYHYPWGDRYLSGSEFDGLCYGIVQTLRFQSGPKGDAWDQIAEARKNQLTEILKYYLRIRTKVDREVIAELQEKLIGLMR